MSGRSKSLLRAAVLLVVLIALAVGGFQVLMGGDGPQLPDGSSTAVATSTADPGRPDLAPVDEAAAPKTERAAQAGELPVKLESEVDVAESAGRPAAVAAPRKTWKAAEGQFAGRVLEPGGTGIKGAKVMLLGLDEQRIKGIPEGMRAMWIAQMKTNQAQLLSLLKPIGTCETDAEGRFGFAAPPGDSERWLRVEHPAFCDVVSDDFKEAPASLSVTLMRGGTVEVSVSTPDGSPIEQGRVTLELGEDTTPSVQASPLAFHVDTTSFSGNGNPWAAVAVAKAKAVAEEEKAGKAVAKDAAAKPGKEAAAKPATGTADGEPALAVTPPAPPAPSKTHSQTLTSVPPGRHTVYASANGFKTTSAEVNVLDGGTSQLKVTLEVGLTLRGTVVDERGEPLAKANVWGWRMSDMRKARLQRQSSATTDAQGAFTLKGLDQAVYRVSANLQGYQQVDWNTNATAGGDPVKVTLTKTRTIRGKVVVEPGGEPAGAGVTVEAKSKDPRMWFGRGPHTTKDDGTFEVAGLVPGRYTLTAKSDTLTTLDPLPVTVGDEDPEVVIKVRAGASAEVLVVAKNGGPVEGAKVAVLTASEARWNRGWIVGGQQKTPVTDADGKTKLTGLGPGEYRVQVVGEGYARGEATLRVDEGREPGQVRVELVPAATLKCTIRREDGTPLAATTIAIMPKDTGLMSPAAFQNAVATDAQGRFTKGGLAAGAYRLQMMDMAGGKGGALRPIGEVRLAAGQTAEVELQLPTAAASVRGSVVQGGKPVGGVQVMIYQENDLLAGFAQTVTDAEGKFSAEKLAPGKYVVTASGAAKATVELGKRSAVEVALEIQAGVVAGRVVGPDGSPARGARLYLQRVDAGATLEEQFRQAEAADGLGLFKLDKVRPGRYRLIASAPGVGSSRSEEFTLGADEARTGLNVALTAGGTLALSVSNPDGTPAVGAQVSFYQVDLKVFSQQVSGWGGGESTTDRHGQVKLENLIPGKYVVFVSSAGHKQALLEGVTVGEGGVASPTATLAAPGALEVSAPPNTQITVTLAKSGTPVGSSGLPWASLFGLSKTDASGAFKVGDLPSVEVEVRGKTPDGRQVGPWRGTIPAGDTAKASLN